jgi:hypothetical protein
MEVSAHPFQHFELVIPHIYLCKDGKMFLRDSLGGARSTTFFGGQNCERG